MKLLPIALTAKDSMIEPVHSYVPYTNYNAKSIRDSNS